MKKYFCLAVLMFACIGTSASAETESASLDRAKVIFSAQDVIGQAQYCTFVTIGKNGQPDARIVDPSAPDGDLSVWVVTKKSSRKAAQLRKNPRATLLYFDHENLSYVTLIGNTTFVSDPAEMDKHWQDKWAPFFPEGTKSPDLVLVHFVPRSVEIVSREHKLQKDPWGLTIFKLR